MQKRSLQPKAQYLGSISWEITLTMQLSTMPIEENEYRMRHMMQLDAESRLQRELQLMPELNAQWSKACLSQKNMHSCHTPIQTL
mmetsp:Transcript_14749/g.31494  ORF Transcript_14749/g.31494 Transcript_14749/m.31494 type:complete len:85 (-) Transcript_14749:1905-2159(-)